MSLVVDLPFQRNLRKRTQPRTKSASSLYREKVRRNNPEHYERIQEKDRERKRDSYIPIEYMTEKQAKMQRKKWKKAKKLQRRKKAANVVQLPEGQELHQAGPPRKKIKLMTHDEKKEYNRVKTRESRARRSKQKNTSDRKKDAARQRSSDEPGHSESPSTSAHGIAKKKKGTSRASIFRKAKSIREQLPSSPATRSKVAGHLQGVRGVKRRLLYADESHVTDAIAQAIQAEVQELRTNRMTEQKRQHYKFLTNSARRATRKYKKVRKYVSRFLGIGGKVIRTKNLRRKKRKDALPESTKNLVRSFWMSENVSREVPLKKRVKKGGQPPFLLECTYLEAFRKFTASHPDVSIGYCKFVQLKPCNVMLMKALERVVCCCIKCENVKLKTKALNTNASVMKVNIQTKNMDDLTKLTICPPKENDKVSMKCLNRECRECSTDAVKQHYQPLVNAHQKDEQTGTHVTFNEWRSVKEEYEVRSKGKEKEAKQKKTVNRLKLVTDKKPVDQVISLLMKDMEAYPAHKFRADWQKKQLNDLKDNLPPKSAAVVIDFAMNYTCFLQDEVQSYHWSPPQVTLHPCYAYINASSAASAPTHTEAVIFISSDLRHDAAAVAKFMELCSGHLKKSYGITNLIQFSDCAASQYRCSTSFADLSFCMEDLGVITQRNYFESSHGKSPADGQGAIIKRAVTNAVTRREAQVRSAEEFYQFCQQSLTDVGKSIWDYRQAEYEHAKRTFMFVNTQDSTGALTF